MDKDIKESSPVELKAADKEPTKKTSRNKAALVPIDFITEEQEPDIDNDRFSLSWCMYKF